MARRGVGVASRLGLENRLHVFRPGQREQPGAVFEGRGQLSGREANVLFEPEHEPGIDAAGSGGHHQALERGEAHGRVDGDPPVNRGQRRAGTEVARHDPQAMRTRPCELRGATRDVGVREPVEPVAAEVPPAPPLGRQRVGRGRWRHPGVKGSVEAGNLRRLGQQPAKRVEAGE